MIQKKEYISLLRERKRKNKKRRKDNESWERIANQSLCKAGKINSLKCPCALVQREAKKDYLFQRIINGEE